MDRIERAAFVDDRSIDGSKMAAVLPVSAIAS
jgi:hypothetical protein